jgi:hypothetical protein
MTTLTLTLTIEQARAVSAMLESAVRISIGQVEEVVFMVCAQERNPDTVETADGLCRAIKTTVGISRNGSHGIGSGLVSVGAKRAYEVVKVMQQALAVHHNPNPDFKGVHYDGLTVRYTQDPAPVAKIEDQA